MKTFLALCCLLSMSLAQNDTEWEDFKKKFRSDAKRKYKDASEEKKRQGIFRKNMDVIKTHNKQFDEGKKTFQMGVNQFADMTSEEFTKMLNGTRFPRQRNMLKHEILYVRDPEATAVKIDWRETKCVGPVKDQLKCGSCYATAAIAATEFYNCYQKNKSLVVLSEQNMLDCTYKGKYRNYGCDGGAADSCWEYIVDNGGVATEASYPYEAKVGPCRYKAENSGGTLRGFVRLPYDNVTALKDSLVARGAIVVPFHGSLIEVQLYKSGVFEGEKCRTEMFDHGMLLVGYDNDGKQDYWLLKNSWGTTWGEQGYMRVIRNFENICGMATTPFYVQT